MRKLINYVGVCSVALMAYLMVGCTMTGGLRMPNVKYVYPNSNVVPIGHVEAKSTSMSVLFVPTVSAKEINDTIDKALAQKGGDVLLDSKIVFRSTMLPPFIFVNTLNIEGTAAKMTVGKQELH